MAGKGYNVLHASEQVREEARHLFTAPSPLEKYQKAGSILFPLREFQCSPKMPQAPPRADVSDLSFHFLSSSKCFKNLDVKGKNAEQTPRV